MVKTDSDARSTRVKTEALSEKKRLCMDSSGIMCAYIQIPFCRSLCSFCCWRQHYNPKEILHIDKYRVQYVKALKGEIRARSSIEEEREKTALEVIHFGGGTPSLLEPSELSEILAHLLSCYGLSRDRVRTIGIEVRQDDLSPAYLRALKDIGFNRISIGAQSFNRDVLARLNRRISPDDFLRAYDYIRDAGFDEVNIDLLYGFPIQDAEMINDDAKKIAGLRPDHIDAHPWKETDGCLRGFPGEYRDEKAKKIAAARFMKDLFADAGYENYNHRCFCLPGKENLMHLIEAAYCLPFIAFGAGSEQYRMPKNTCSIENYIRDPFDKGQFTRVSQRKPEEATLLRCIDSLSRQLLLPEGVCIPFFNRTQNCDLADILDYYSSEDNYEKLAAGYYDILSRSRVQIFRKVLHWLRDGIIYNKGDWLRLREEYTVSAGTWVLYMQAC